MKKPKTTIDHFDLSCHGNGAFHLVSGLCRSHEFNLHFHAEFTLGLVDAGQEDFLLAGRLRRLQRGAVYLLAPHAPHASNAVDAAGWAYRSLYIEPELVAEIHPGLARSPRNIIIRHGHLYTAISEIIRELEQTGDAATKIQMLKKALSLLTGHPDFLDASAHSEPFLPRRIRKVRDTMMANAAGPLRLGDLAALVDWHPHYLAERFRDYLGISPMAYVTSCRLTMAKVRLASGDAIAETAVNAGFFDQSHLCRHFKRALGVTPGAFRRTFQASEFRPITTRSAKIIRM